MRDQKHKQESTSISMQPHTENTKASTARGRIPRALRSVLTKAVGQRKGREPSGSCVHVVRGQKPHLLVVNFIMDCRVRMVQRTLPRTGSNRGRPARVFAADPATVPS
jgi:hypothetical protein